MQIVLLVAGIGSLCPLKEYGTGSSILLLTVFNAVLGLQQEGKAAAAVAALQKMMFIKARVRRDGELVELPAEQLVPGDVVAIEAGDVVPADGRLLEAATLEVAESALTGESVPVSKGVETVESADAPLGDRTDMVYMNTNVTRGTGAFVVTATGWRPRSATSRTCSSARTTRHAADDAAREADDADPLHRPALAVVTSIIINISRGYDVQEVFTAALAFAIAAIPTGLPAVVTTILSMGHAAAREGERDREAAALDRDARRDLGDQLRQDRHADAEPDDRGRDGDPRPAVHDLRQRLLDRGHDHARRPASDVPLDQFLMPMVARLGRGVKRRRDDRRPDRGRARRARREGRARRRVDPRDATRASRSCRSTPSTS